MNKQWCEQQIMIFIQYLNEIAIVEIQIKTGKDEIRQIIWT